MLQDTISSFNNKFKDSPKNPFLGTYLVVWIVRNWDLIFTIFNFDKDCTRQEKISIIKQFIPNSLTEILLNIWYNTAWTFSILALSYLLINLSRFIVYFSEKKIRPNVSRLTDSNSIVLKSTYLKAKEDTEALQNELENVRSSKLKLEKELQAKSSEFVGLTDEISKHEEKIRTLEKFAIDDQKKIEEKDEQLNNYKSLEVETNTKLQDLHLETEWIHTENIRLKRKLEAYQNNNGKNKEEINFNFPELFQLFNSFQSDEGYRFTPESIVEILERNNLQKKYLNFINREYDHLDEYDLNLIGLFQILNLVEHDFKQSLDHPDEQPIIEFTRLGRKIAEIIQDNLSHR